MRKEFEDMYGKMHKNNADLFNGSALVLHAQTIHDMIERSRSKTLLDYGCGKGYQYSKQKLHDEYFYGILPTLYDPGVPGIDKIPEGEFDGVFCTDVLEHIPESVIPDILSEIFDKANKFVYLGICTIPSKSYLPTGEDSHVTIKPFDWWVDLILPYANIDTNIYCYGDTRGTCVYRTDDKSIFKKER